MLAFSQEHLLNYYNEKHGTCYGRDDTHTYELSEVWGGTREGAIAEVLEFYRSPHFDEVQPVSDSVKGIDELVKSHELVVVTARPIVVKEATEQWIERYFERKFAGVYFTNEWGMSGRKKTKEDICTELGVEVLVEDGLHYARACAAQGVGVLLFDAPWNQIRELPANVKRIYGWQGSERKPGVLDKLL